MGMVSPIEELKSAREELVSKFSRGEVSGAFGESYTEIVDQYFRRCLVDSNSRGPFTFIAVGGYGRRELALHSDIDVVILFRTKIPADAKNLVEKIFYPMWDLGLDLGNGIRTINDCISLARQNFEVLTSLLDSRFICGDPGLYFSLMESLQAKAVSKKTKLFGKWLEEVSRVRMATFGDASYLLEPNLKEGIGGLRDYHHILWLSKVFFKLAVPRDMEYAGVLSHGEYGRLKEDLDFIALVRNHLHLLSGRRNDRLTFDLQEKIAGILNFKARDDLLAVEQFLSRLHAAMASIKSLHRSFVLTHMPNRTSARGNTKPERLSAHIHARQGEIGFTSAGAILSNPHLLMEPFEWSSRLNYPLSLETRRLIRDFLYLIDDEFRGSEKVIRSFLSILKGSYAFEALDQMDEVGMLGTFIPEFEHIRARVQFDSYHIYPVGTHLLQTLRNLKNLRTEKNLLLLGMLTDIPNPEALFLACLLHDIGKVGRNHSRRGATIARRILDRIGLDRLPAEDVLFLITHHLLLAEVATRRDLNDEKVVVQCARTMGTIERLKMLYLLTWADSKATGPRAWSDWTENLVTELFFKILHTMEQGELATPDASKRIRSTLQHVRKALGSEGADPHELESIFETLPPRYLLETAHRDMVRHIHMYQEHRRDFKRNPTSAFGLEVRRGHPGTTWEIVFVAKDRPGLFSDLAGVLALNNINILSAHIYTWMDGTAVDIFKVSDPLDPLHPERVWKKVKQDLAAVFSGNLDLPSTLEEKSNGFISAPRWSINPSEVRIDNQSSDFFTIIEVFADDKIGLLYLITHTLFQLGLDISIAKISTKGDQIADVFYVRDTEGQKVEEENRVEEIKRVVMERLKSANDGSIGERKVPWPIGTTSSSR